ncbi:hypothetical protein BON30_05055 [Cystobacter ferrugineus]|uniref:PEGA domain-containing protein n=1 Tax=Cystobacter ferrugineus TaxID=83449 RepID=A0A1L9BKW2_9BACT|nr:hypothetical protein BON30_05055 [Cystobacter ferrugineus]
MVLAMSVVLVSLGAPPSLAAPRPRAPQQARNKQRPRASPAPGPSSSEAPPSSLAPDAPTAPEATPPTPPPSAAPERPWAQGVSPENQQRALELFQTGNALLKDAVFVQASEKYRKALELWSHPAIHYNLALALMNLDQPLEVYEHLVAALRFGAEPLEADKFEYARNYKLLLEKQLARLDVTCDTPGATVLLDGKPLFQAPGHYSGLVRPGAHTFSATLQGYLPQNLNRTVLPGETANITLRLYTTEELTRYRRRFSVAMPWLVMGAGAALAGGSAWMHVRARAHFRSFDAGIAACGGCVPPLPLATQLERGYLLQTSAITGYTVGGAAFITGAILTALNQPQPYRIDPAQLAQPQVSIRPLLGGGSGGVQALVRF